MHLAEAVEHRWAVRRGEGGRGRGVFTPFTRPPRVALLRPAAGRRRALPSMAAEAAASSGMDRMLTRYDAARDGGRVR